MKGYVVIKYYNSGDFELSTVFLDKYDAITLCKYFNKEHAVEQLVEPDFWWDWETVSIEGSI